MTFSSPALAINHSVPPLDSVNWLTLGIGMGVPIGASVAGDS